MLRGTTPLGRPAAAGGGRERRGGLVAGATAVLTGLLAAGAGRPTAAAARAGGGGREAAPTLLGAWEVEFRRADLPPGGPPAVVQFVLSEGGGVVAQTGPGALGADDQPVYLSVGVGAWAATGERAYEYHYTYRRTDARFALVSLATTWLRLTLEGTGSAWRGAWRRRDLDAAGNVVLDVGGTATGRRLPVQSLA